MNIFEQLGTMRCRSLASLLVVCLITIYSADANADVTYTYTGNPFDISQCNALIAPFGSSFANVQCVAGNEIVSLTFDDSVSNFTGEIFNNSPVGKLLSFSASALGNTIDTSNGTINYEIFLTNGKVGNAFVQILEGTPSLGIEASTVTINNLNSSGCTFNTIGPTVCDFSFVETFDSHFQTISELFGYNDNNLGTWSTGPSGPNPVTFGGGEEVADASDLPSSSENPSEIGPQSQPDTPGDGCSSTCEPVRTSTGNEFETERDFVGAPSTGLGLTRYYNSLDNTQSPFGTGWRDAWHRGLINIQLNNGGTSSVTAVRADGRQDLFTLNSSNQWVGQPNVTSHLVAVTNGSALISWQLTLADDTVENYLPDGRLTSITTRAGLVTIFAYDANNNLASVTGPFGHAMTFTYDTATPVHHVIGMTAPDGGTYAYAYDANNNLTAVRFPDQAVKQYLYENTSFPHALTGIIDENNSRYVTIAYDAQGRATQTQFAGGVDLTKIAYNSDGSTSVTDANNNTHSFTFSNQFGLLQTSGLTGAPDPAVGGSAFTYDANGFLASKTDFDGNVTAFTHDALGDETSRTQASGTPLARTFSTTWLANFHLPSLVTEPNGRTTAYTYDARGNQLSKVITAGSEIRSQSWAYSAAGQAISMTDPDGNVTSYTYDAHGDLASVKDALGHITHFTSYDGAGRLLSTTDPNGLVTTMTYDARGRLISRKVGGELTSFAYDAAGNLVHMTMPDGSFKTFVYDAAHRLNHVFDALSNQLAFAMDGNSNRTNISAYDPTGTLQQTRSFAYDNVNRLAAEQGAAGQITNYSHDPQGNLLSRSDPLDHVTSFAYDPLNRRVQNTDAEGGITGYAYDIVDNLIAESDPRNLVTDYGYDGLSDQTGTASPDAGTTIRTFDAVGNVISSTDARGAKTVYSYDDLNRLVEAKYADGTSSSYQYDQGTNGIGHLTKMVDPAGTTTYSYDQHGRITQKQQQTGSVHLTTKYAYDTAGRLAAIQYPSGKTINIAYDAAGQVLSLSQNGHALATSIVHRPFGPASAWKQGNGVIFARNFDLDGRIASITGSNNLSYTYDAANRITAFAETGFANEQYGYDALDRLTGFMEGTQPTTYSYDANGNRLKLDAPGTAIDQVYAYDAASNRLLKDTTGTGKKADVDAYAYDAAGNTLSDGDHSFTYDARGRMASVQTDEDERHDRDFFGFWSFWNNHRNEKDKTDFDINGLGERVVKSSATNTTIYYYDEAGHITGEYDGRGNVLEETVYLGNIPIAVLGGGSAGDWGQHFILPFGLNSQDIHYIGTDNLGAPHTITDSRGRKVWEWHHTPFGDSQPQEQGFTYNLRFPGQIYGPELGLNYNMARDYNPGTGRYMQSDPIGLIGGVNTYTYARGYPLDRIDPKGLQYEPVIDRIVDWAEEDGPVMIDQLQVLWDRALPYIYQSINTINTNSWVAGPFGYEFQTRIGDIPELYGENANAAAQGGAMVAKLFEAYKEYQATHFEETPIDPVYGSNQCFNSSQQSFSTPTQNYSEPVPLMTPIPLQ